MIVDDHHALAAILSFEIDRARSSATGGGPVVYLDARVPGILHLRLVSAIHKRTTGRLTQFIQSVDVAERAAIFDVISVPRPGSVTVLDDRPLAGAIGALTAEPGVSIAFGALIAHAQMTGQPILADPANAGRWTTVAVARAVEVVMAPARVRSPQ